jgi:transcriptional regulator, LysR family
VCAFAFERAVPSQQIQDLARHMLLHPSRDEHDWRLWLQAAGVALEAQGPKQHFETLDMAMAMASQGTGVAIGDWALIGDDLRGGRLCMPFALKVQTGKGYYLVSQAKSLPQGCRSSWTGWRARPVHELWSSQ